MEDASPKDAPTAVFKDGPIPDAPLVDSPPPLDALVAAPLDAPPVVATLDAPPVDAPPVVATLDAPLVVAPSAISLDLERWVGTFIDIHEKYEKVRNEKDKMADLIERLRGMESLMETRPDLVDSHYDMYVTFSKKESLLKENLDAMTVEYDTLYAIFMRAPASASASTAAAEAAAAAAAKAAPATAAATDTVMVNAAAVVSPSARKRNTLETASPRLTGNRRVGAQNSIWQTTCSRLWAPQKDRTLKVGQAVVYVSQFEFNVTPVYRYIDAELAGHDGKFEPIAFTGLQRRNIVAAVGESRFSLRDTPIYQIGNDPRNKYAMDIGMVIIRADGDVYTNPTVDKNDKPYKSIQLRRNRHVGPTMWSRFKHIKKDVENGVLAQGYALFFDERRQHQTSEVNAVAAAPMVIACPERYFVSINQFDGIFDATDAVFRPKLFMKLTPSTKKLNKKALHVLFSETVANYLWIEEGQWRAEVKAYEAKRRQGTSVSDEDDEEEHEDPEEEEEEDDGDGGEEDELVAPGAPIKKPRYE